MEILKVQNLCKTYGTGEAKVDALKNVSFSLEKGEFVAVVGESGSGKSTLLNCIGALDVPTSGTVTMDGNNLFSMKEEERTIFRRRNIGFIFQAFQLFSSSVPFYDRSRLPCSCRPESHKRNTCEPASVSCSPCRSILPCRQVRRETNIYVLSFCESSLSFFCILSNSSIAVLLAEIKMLQKLYCLQYYN